MLISHWPVKLSAFLFMAVVPVIAQQEPAKVAETAKAKSKATAKSKAAGPNTKAFQRIIQDLDTNQDETLQRSEVPESARTEFDELLKLMDENKDKALSRGELQASGAKLQKIFGAGAAQGQAPEAGPMMNAQRLKRLDKNGDGFISKDEFPNGAPPFFDRLDLNGDGRIGPIELQTLASMNPQNPAAVNGPETRLKQMDKDADGRISRQEWAGAPAMFDRMDKDGDGSLSASEQKAAINALKKAAEKSKKKAD